MKALSLYQPWASMIARKQKTIETRTRRTSYRGELLICSSLKPEIPGLPLGKALCVVEVIDCRPMEPRDEKAAQCSFYDKRFSWILYNIRRIEPFAVRGRQGLFNVPVNREELVFV